MATETKTAQTPKNDVFANAAELVIDSLEGAAKQREEMEKITRESLEKMNALVRASGQTNLDLFDFGVRIAGTWQQIAVDALRNATGLVKKAAARA